MGPLLPFTERIESNWFNNIILEAKSFIDVGAYIGGYAVRARKAGLKVIAIEPNPENYNQLTRNLELDRCYSCLPLKIAAGDTAQKSILLMDHNTSRITQVKRGGAQYVEVDIGLLDEVINVGELDYPMAVKIDVEGCEKRVLKGMKQILNYTKYLIIESRDIKSIKEFLEKEEYKLRDVCYHGDWGIFNIFFVKRSN